MSKLLEKIVLAFIFLSILQLTSAHGISKEAEIKEYENYSIEFKTSPKYPATLINTHLEIFLLNKNTKERIDDAEVVFIITADSMETTLKTENEKNGEYHTDYIFNEGGKYKIEIVVNGIKTSEFYLDVESFIPKGAFDVLLLIIIYGGLIALVIKDYKKLNKPEFGEAKP